MSPRDGRGASPRVVVVGGGVSGLASAYFVLRKVPNAQVTVLESRARLGGNVRTLATAGTVVDAGPDAVMVSPAVTELCEAIGGVDTLLSPRAEARRVSLALDGAIVPMPEGLAMGVPTSLWALARTPLLSLRGKAPPMKSL